MKPRRARTSASCPTSRNGKNANDLLMEKEVLGFYLTSHPLAEHAKPNCAAYCTHTTTDLARLPDRTEVFVGGMLSSIKTGPRPQGA